MTASDPQHLPDRRIPGRCSMPERPIFVGLAIFWVGAAVAIVAALISSTFRAPIGGL